MLAVHHPHRSSTRLVLGLAIAGIAGIGLSLLAHPSRPARASDPMGIYTLVEDVVIEATKPGEPERVRVYGISALAYRPPAEGGRFQGGVYSDPASGYLYFTCPEGRAEVCRMEWADLQKAIGDERCAAYGDRYLTDPKPNGRLRPADEPPDAPDTYPIGQGVVMTRQGSQSTCDAIRELAAAGAVPTAAGAEADGSYLPSLAAKAPEGAAATAASSAKAASGSVNPVQPGAAAASEGGGTGPASLTPLAVLLLLGIGAMGVVTAAAWSRRRA